MSTDLSGYLAEIYEQGFEKRAVDYGFDAGRIGTAAGLGAGIGGLGGLARYYLMDDKKRRRASLLNNIAGGALLGGSAGAATQFMPDTSQVVDVFKTGDTKPPEIVRKITSLVGGIARPLVTGTASYAANKSRLPGGYGGRALPVALQTVRSALFGDGLAPGDDTAFAAAGRAGIDAATGAWFADTLGRPTAQAVKEYAALQEKAKKLAIARAKVIREFNDKRRLDIDKMVQQRRKYRGTVPDFDVQMQQNQFRHENLRRDNQLRKLKLALPKDTKKMRRAATMPKRKTRIARGIAGALLSMALGYASDQAVKGVQNYLGSQLS